MFIYDLATASGLGPLPWRVAMMGKPPYGVGACVYAEIGMSVCVFARMFESVKNQHDDE
jgi:hypothetical protein